jgi:hypothetical protein
MATRLTASADRDCYTPSTVNKRIFQELETCPYMQKSKSTINKTSNICTLKEKKKKGKGNQPGKS